MDEQECLAIVERYFTKIEKERAQQITGIESNKVQFSKAESTKGERGYKVEATGAKMDDVMYRAIQMKVKAEEETRE